MSDSDRKRLMGCEMGRRGNNGFVLRLAAVRGGRERGLDLIVAYFSQHYIFDDVDICCPLVQSQSLI